MLALRNTYFACLPDPIKRRWRPELSLVEFHKGELLQRPQEPEVIWFPVTCVATMSARSGEGPATSMRFSGNNFVVGLADLLKASTVNFEGIICGQGYAFALPIRCFLETFPAPGPSSTLSAIAMASIAEKAFYAARCSSSHTVKQRLAGLLLDASDAFGEERSVTLNQNELSEILVVRRETVALLTGDWSAAGIISTTRGAFRIVDRPRLTADGCECYALIRRLQEQELEVWKGIQWRTD